MNEEIITPTTPNKYSLQEYLSLGYIYLIILGIVSDVIYYKFLGVNILNYATISDVLMSPINTLIYDIRVIIIFALLYLVYIKVLPRFHQVNKEKSWYKKVVKDMDKSDKKFIELKSINKRIETILLFLILWFIGLKIGAGLSIKNKIEKGTISVDHSIIFNDDTSERVKIVGQNSSYLFYLMEGQKEVSITPISGNVKMLKMERGSKE